MPQRRRLWGKCACCFYPKSAIKTVPWGCLDAGLTAQDVDHKEHDNHQDGDPNRYFPERADTCHAPVQGETLGAGETSVAIPAGLRLKRADATTFRAGFGIEPLRHTREIARTRKNFQWYERGRRAGSFKPAVNSSLVDDRGTREEFAKFFPAKCKNLAQVRGKTMVKHKLPACSKWER